MSLILLISGSLREGSTNSAALRTAQEVAPASCSSAIYTGMGSLPHFNPDQDREGDRFTRPSRTFERTSTRLMQS
jgi:NAD(P)H-dependent FMN reductase